MIVENFEPVRSKKRPRWRPGFCPRSPINLTVHFYSQKRPASPPPTRTESPHDTTTQQSAHTTSRETHATFLLSPLSLCGIAGIVHVRIAPASATLYGNRAHRATASNYSGGRSVERERESERPPRGALQARHVVSIQSSAIPSRVTAHHQGARVQHTPRSVHRVPRAVVMFRHVSSCFRHVPLSAAIGWASRPRMSHDCHLMATDEP